MNTWNTLSPTLTGVGPALGSLIVTMTYDVGKTNTEVEYCSIDEIPVSGTWNCIGPAALTWEFVRFDIASLDVTGTPAFLGPAHAIGGTLRPPPPSAAITPRNARIGVSASGAALTSLATELYLVTEIPADVSFFGPLRDECIAAGDPPTLGCDFTGLEPGIWNVYTTQSTGGEGEGGTYLIDDYVRIPAAPTLAAAVTPERTVRLSGTGESGFRVIVQSAGGNQACTAIVGVTGAWQCTVDPGPGPATYRALQQSVGFVADPDSVLEGARSFDGFSALTPSRSVTVPPAPTAPPAAPPAPTITTPTPLPWVLEGYDGSPLTPGQALSLSAIGLPVGTVVDDGEAGAVDDPATDTGSEDGGATSGGAAAPGERANAASPSAISNSIPTIDRIFRTPLLPVLSGGLALAILLLVAFPAELLNSTLASNTRRPGRWYAAIENGVDRATDWFVSVTRTRALAAAVLVVLTSLFFGFVDPDCGFDPVSVRMTVSLAIGLFIVTYVSSWISGAIIRRVWQIETRVSLQPAALVFAVIGVIVARVLEFSPGFLTGLPHRSRHRSRPGTRVGAPHRVRAILTNIGVIVGLSVLAWVGFSIISAVMTGEPTAVGLLVSDALVATTAEGLTAAPAALLPLGFLDGHGVFRRSKLLGAGSFAAVATVFSLIVLPTAADETGEVADVGFWMLVMVTFAVVTLTLWAILHFTGGSDSDDEPVDQPAVAAR